MEQNKRKATWYKETSPAKNGIESETSYACPGLRSKVTPSVTFLNLTAPPPCPTASPCFHFPVLLQSFSLYLLIGSVSSSSREMCHSSWKPRTLQKFSNCLSSLGFFKSCRINHGARISNVAMQFPVMNLESCPGPQK